MPREGGCLAARDTFIAAATRPVVVSDIDGVLNFLGETIATALNARFGSNLACDEITTYRIETVLPTERGRWLQAQFADPVFYRNCPPDWRGVDALAAMRAAGLRVVVSSDRPAVIRDESLRWLDQWGVESDETVLVGPGGKTQTLAAYGPGRPAVLIDDDPGKALTVARAGVQVWSPARPWTPKDWQRYPNYWVFDSWTDALARLGVAESQVSAGITRFSSREGLDRPAATSGEAA